MKLPRIGVTLNADGEIVWGWSFPANWEFSKGYPDGFPPIRSVDGRLVEVGFTPGDHEILDLTEHLAHGEAQEILSHKEKIHWRKQSDGSRVLTYLDVDELSGTTEELPHPFQSRITARTEAKRKANLATGAKTQTDDVQARGFQSPAEMYALLSRLDFSNTDTQSALEIWKNQDGTRDGLLMLETNKKKVK